MNMLLTGITLDYFCPPLNMFLSWSRKTTVNGILKEIEHISANSDLFS